MKVILQGRAEVALRSLDAQDRHRVETILRGLETSDLQALPRDTRLLKLRQLSNVVMYAIRATTRLRIVVSLRDSALVVEDIVPRDRVDHLILDRR
jgi:hypothetical protein